MAIKCFSYCWYPHTLQHPINVLKYYSCYFAIIQHGGSFCNIGVYAICSNNTIGIGDQKQRQDFPSSIYLNLASNALTNSKLS